eukprot:jgi/Chrzof1/13637/Cz08g05100.t1
MHSSQIRNRDEAIHKIEALMLKLTDDPKSHFLFVPESRWMSIFREHSFKVTTRHGRPLHPQEGHEHDKPFPWKGVGYIRLRSYRLLTPAGAYVPGSAPGTADLTFKMKKVDPEVQVQGLDMPHEVGRSVVPDNIQVSVQQR